MTAVLRGASPATVADWLSQHDPMQPTALRERLQELLAADAGRPAAQVPEVFIRVGKRLLEQIVNTDEPGDRRNAADLLAVDALVTYAFQAAAELPAELDEKAGDTMIQLAELSLGLRGLHGSQGSV